MMDLAIFWDWAGFVARWLHVITAMAWIGSSFYFVALDLGLRQSPHLPVGAHGEEWQVHGGGFYHIRKYLVAPEHLPEHLIWFKWESYTTWLSGAALLMIVYWVGGELYLIDAAKADPDSLNYCSAGTGTAPHLTMEWMLKAADIEISQEIPMVLNDAGVIGLSLNGKAWPETAPIAADKGDWILLHYYNEGLVGHPMHLHSQPHIVIAKDGYPLAAPYRVDTTWISPGERYSVLIKADNVGTWAFHCHIINHAEDDDGLMGMVTAMIVNDPNAA